MSSKKLSFLIVNLFFGLIIPFYANSQAQDCTSIKDGIYYSYPKNSADKYMYIRNGDVMHERNLKTGDTAVWEIKWISSCVYSSKYISGSEKLTEEVSKLLKKHTLVYQVIDISKDYYVYKGYFDKTSNLPFTTDTMWLNEKVQLVSNELFKPVKNVSELRKDKFSDTSKYAVLYLYRPGKATLFLSSYLIYFDNIPMCVAKNKSGFIFKIQKEGDFEIKSKVEKKEASIKLNIQFGKTYYVKSLMNWGIYKDLKNYKLEMVIPKPEEAKLEFAEVNLQ
jgi:hypothetical protein